MGVCEMRELVPLTGKGGKKGIERKRLSRVVVGYHS
jgi:hypothetical protein